MKKLLSFLLTLTLFASIVTISSFAFDIPANSESCTIKKNEAYSYSNYVVGNFKYYGGQNYSDSTSKLNVTALYFDGSSNKYLEDTHTTIPPYDNFMDEETKHYNGPLCWRVYLSPSGLHSNGCFGRGYIRNK